MMVAAIVVPMGVAPAVAAPAAVTGPVTGGVHGYPFRSYAQPGYDVVGPAGYTEQEYFLEGTASSYTSGSPLSSDGVWSVAPADTAPFKTRLVVRRPADPAAFNGTVIVEWLNVTASFDIDPDWAYGHTEMMREGYAWVGVSAQKAGVDGPSGNALTSWDPARYGSLVHPGDSFSYDIFTQAGAALRNPTGVDPLGGLRPSAIIADGESQSASRMVTYVDAVQPLAHVFDGFMIHSRSAGGAALSQAPQADVPTPRPTQIRTDLGVPVLTVQSETDVSFSGWLDARQPDTSAARQWEIAGTAHADQYISDFGAPVLARDLPSFGGFPCDVPYNSGPHHFVFNAAVQALDRWVTLGVVPPSAPRVDLTGPPEAAQRDANGNALGGIRTPELDVPVATLSGAGNTPAGLCALFGVTIPFSQDKINSVYPSQDDYLAKFVRATDDAIQTGFVLAADRHEIIDSVDSRRYVAPSPQRLADTREGLGLPKGQLQPGQVARLKVRGVYGVSQLARAVVLNLTAVGSAGDGWVRAYACDTPPAADASNLNPAADRIVANLAVVNLDDSGSVCFTTYGATDLVVDLQGWYPINTEYQAVPLTRIADSRTGTGISTRLTPYQVVGLQVAGKNGIPSDASAAVLNLTAVAQTSGWIVAFPCGTPPPAASNLNTWPGHAIANATVTAIGTGGSICFQSNIATDLIVDLQGSYPADASYHAFAPVRALDTRTDATPLTPGNVRVLPIAGSYGVPTSATVVSVNVTAVNATGPAWVKTFPCGQAPPISSNNNTSPDRIVATQTLVPIGAYGSICIAANHTTDIIVDVQGWQTNPSTTT